MNTNATTTATIALRRLCCLVSLLAACLLLALSLAPGAFAKGSYVLDDYGLYDSSIRQELEQSASQLASTYGVAPYLVVVDNIGSQTVRSFAESYWLDHELGIGSDASGIMFLIAVDSRDYVTITHGTGIYAFTDYGIEQLEDAVVSYLGDHEWEDAAGCSGDGFDETHGNVLSRQVIRHIPALWPRVVPVSHARHAPTGAVELELAPGRTAKAARADSRAAKAAAVVIVFRERGDAHMRAGKHVLLGRENDASGQEAGSRRPRGHALELALEDPAHDEGDGKGQQQRDGKRHAQRHDASGRVVV